ncbi:unnamed protein product [Pleuronectes platessa]|uniref:Uncharacterized protein n=1 Tax=Pleuronectes platessa TaxID=8262 RepID=A0A9N7TPZ4_PLEPL|nr:unnamed protein product [Pleuronectes platessa]
MSAVVGKATEQLQVGGRCKPGYMSAPIQLNTKETKHRKLPTHIVGLVLNKKTRAGAQGWFQTWLQEGEGGGSHSPWPLKSPVMSDVQPGKTNIAQIAAVRKPPRQSPPQGVPAKPLNTSAPLEDSVCGALMPGGAALLTQASLPHCNTGSLIRYNKRGNEHCSSDWLTEGVMVCGNYLPQPFTLPCSSSLSHPGSRVLHGTSTSHCPDDICSAFRYTADEQTAVLLLEPNRGIELCGQPPALTPLPWLAVNSLRDREVEARCLGARAPPRHANYNNNGS